MNNGQSAAKLINMKPLPGFEEYYLVSEDGKVWSKRYNKFLKPATTKDGYLQVSITGDNKKEYSYKVHKLVAMTFIDQPEGKPEINHIDFNRANNWVTNLEWCDRYENIKHSRDAGNYDCIYTQTRKAYVFTNVFNSKSFTILGFNNVLKQFDIKKSSNSVIHNNANTGKYIKRGALKGLKVDIIDLEVRRPTAINGVGSSDPKWQVSSTEDEDMA